MRFLDVFMAFPAVIIAVCVAAVTRAGVLTTTLVVAVIYTPQLARVVYANVREQLGEDYVSRRAGDGQRQDPRRRPPRRRQLRGAGARLHRDDRRRRDRARVDAVVHRRRHPAADRVVGNVVAEGKDLMYTGGWWVTTFGGLAIFTAVLALNVLAEGMTDALSRPRRAPGEEAVDRERLESWERPRDELLAAADRGALLQVDDLTVRFPEAYGPLPLLSSISFDVREGEVVGLVGESGLRQVADRAGDHGAAARRRGAKRLDPATAGATC